MEYTDSPEVLQECRVACLIETLKKAEHRIQLINQSFTIIVWTCSAITSENVTRGRKIIIEDDQYEISEVTNIKILHKELDVRNLLSRWVRHKLTYDQKVQRVRISQDTLKSLNNVTYVKLRMVMIVTFLF